MLAEERLARPNAMAHEDDDPGRWPPWGCKAVALVPPARREDKLSPVAAYGAFVGYDKTVVHGVRVAVLSQGYMNAAEPVEGILVSTTVRTTDAVFPMLDARGATLQELEEFVCDHAMNETDAKDELGTTNQVAENNPEVPPPDGG